MNNDVINFLIFLQNNNLVDIVSVQEDNTYGFKNRFRLQKFIYFAQSRFNLKENYFFSIYKHGPYSRFLTNDAYNLDVSTFNDIEDEMERSGHVFRLPEDFDENRFLSILSDKDDEWLEIASSLIDANDNKIHDKKSILIDYVSSIKPNYNREYIVNVLNDLNREKILFNLSDEMGKVVKRAPDLFEALKMDDIKLIE